MNHNTYRILIVEDEAIIAADIESRIRGFGHVSVGICSDGRRALDEASKSRPDLVLMDIVLKGDVDGIQTAQWIRKILDIPVVFITSHTDHTTVRLACHSEPFGYILKPIEDRELRIGLELALSRHRSESKLREMERWLTTTLNSIGDGVISVSLEGRVMLLNPLAERLTGWSASEAQGRLIEDVFPLFHAESGQSVPNPALQAMRSGVLVHIDRQTRLRPRNGESFYIDDSAAPIRGEGGQVRGAVIVFRDATDRVRNEEQMRLWNTTLERQVQARTQELQRVVQDLEHFTGAVSHDLKSPARAVQGYSVLLADRLQSNIDPESQDLLRKIQRGTVRMASMIDAFQRLARMQRQPLREQRIDMNRLVQEIVNEVASEYPSTRFRVDISELLPATGDPDLLRQCWSNLISNAFKYSSHQTHPQIQIQSHMESDLVVYEVVDNGVGLDLNHADLLFQPFQRFHEAADFEGQGMGLATVKQVIDRHGGRVNVQSSPGQGARFSFSIPIQPGSASTQPSSLNVVDRRSQPIAPSTEGNEVEHSIARSSEDLKSFPRSVTGRDQQASTPHSILIVEDEAIIAADLASRLQRLGYRVVGTVNSGEQAVAFVRRHQPDLVLMDIRLKTDMDGIEAARRIGQELSVPAVYVTSHSDPATFHRAKSANMLGYVLKPFQDRELVMAIEFALVRAESEKRLADSKRWLDATLRSITDGVIATDPRGRILFMNAAAEQMTGWSEQAAFQRQLQNVMLVLDEKSGRIVSSPVALNLLHPHSVECDRESILACGEMRIPIHECGSLIRNEQGHVLGGLLLFRDISRLKASEGEREKIILELKQALEHVQTLRGLLPVCAWCRKVRDDDGYWKLFEDYLRVHTEADITHSICPSCIQGLSQSPSSS